MTTVALDTNVLTLLLRGDTAQIRQTLDRIDTFYVPWAVYGELLAGTHAGSNPAKYIPLLEDFLNQSFIELSAITASDTVEHYAHIFATLKKNGTPVSPNDLWIAAECAKTGLPLYTLDKDFGAIPHILLFS